MKPQPSTASLMLLRPPTRPRNPISRFQCRNIQSRAVTVLACRVLQSQSKVQHSHRKLQFHSPPLSLRHQSTAAATASKPIPSATIVSKPDSKSAKPTTRPAAPPRATFHPLATLNPPSETYAPPLDLPTRLPGDNILGYLWRTGRAYLSFYKTSISRVRNNHKLSKRYSAKLLSPILSPSLSSKTLPNAPAMQALQEIKTVNGETIMLPGITRAEWVLIRRSRKDIWRLPGFGVLVLVFGEWLPLIALWITPVVPEPCRIPRQVRRAEVKREKRRHERLRRLAMDERRGSIGLGKEATPAAGQEGVDLKDMDHRTLLQLSARLDAHSGIWDLLFLHPPKGLLRWSLAKKVRYLDLDDALILRDGGVSGLSNLEVKLACRERGFDTLDKGEEELRRALRAWFKKA